MRGHACSRLDRPSMGEQTIFLLVLKLLYPKLKYGKVTLSDTGEFM